MSILKSPRPSSNQSPEGFSWNIRISEGVLVTLLFVGSSFTAGFAYGQAQAAQAVSFLIEMATTDFYTVLPRCFH